MMQMQPYSRWCSRPSSLPLSAAATAAAAVLQCGAYHRLLDLVVDGHDARTGGAAGERQTGRE